MKSDTYRIQVNGFSSGEISTIQNALSTLCSDGLEQIHKSSSTATYRFRACGSLDTATEIDQQINRALLGNNIQGDVSYQDNKFTVLKYIPASEAEPEEPPMIAQCVYPETSTRAPGWVCHEPIDGYDVIGVGSAEPKANESFGPSFYRNLARARAQGDLLNSATTWVGTSIKNMRGTAGSYDEQRIENCISGRLQRASVLRTMVAPNGVYWTLVGMKRSDARVLLREVQTSCSP